VDDLIRGLYLLCDERGAPARQHRNPNEFTLLELAEAVIRISGSSSEIIFEALPIDDA
jgi:dTDP-glucose 4,6-dehydratase